MAESISIAETNKIRIAAGLAPLADTEAGDAPVLNDEEIAVQNWQQLKEQEASEQATRDLKSRLDKARNQRQLKAKLVGKGLGDADADDDGNARAWVKKAKKQAKAMAAQLAAKREQELAEMDAELARSYAEDDLAGLKVGHDAEAFDEGREHVLTLKDSRVLDDADDELVDNDLAEQKRLEERLDLKKKGKDALKYKPYEDDEMTHGGKKRGVLSKYDVDIDGGDTAVQLGFTLAGSSRDNSRQEAESTTFEAVAKPVVKSTEARQELAKELNRTLVDLSHEKNFSTSDYMQEGDAGFKKSKKKKKSSKTSSRRRDVDQDEDAEGDAVMVNRTTQEELDRQAFIDDEDLQSALARQRRAKNRQKLEALRQAQTNGSAEDSMPIDSINSPLANGTNNSTDDIDLARVKDEPDSDQDDKGLVLDDTSEFVRNITLDAPTVKRSDSVQPKPQLEPAPVPASQSGRQTADQIITSIDTETNGVKDEEMEEGETMDIDAEERAAEEALLAGDDGQSLAQVDGIEGTSAELHVNRGMMSTMNMLRQQGLIKPLTPEEIAKASLYKDRQQWLVQRRQQQADLEAAKYAARQAGASKDQRTRELENRAREKEMARRDLEAFKDYKPQIEIKYTDDHGREMTPKEAWKDLSHKFHGKGSGTMKIEKRLKKIEDEKKRAAMASGDTPLSVNAAFQARQEKLGSATMVLSVGNKMTAPNADDFQTSGSVDPSKKAIPKKGKGKALAASSDINLTPTLSAPITQVAVSEAAGDGSFTPVPRRAGFKPINKRSIEETAANEAESESKRLKQ